MKKRISVYIIPFILFFVFGIVLCQNRSTDEAENGTLKLTENEKKTLQSLQKIDDYPLYTMTYYGDYGFDEFLKTDLSNRHDRLKNFFNVIKNGWKCSCFAAYGNKDNPVFGRNFDWYHRASLLLFTNPPNGYASVSMVDVFYCGYENEVPMSVSGDRTGLLGAPLIPFDGMNEMGLVVGMMAVPYAEAPNDPGKQTLYDLQIMRLVLDYASDIDEAVNLIKKYNYHFDAVPVHFLIADRNGSTAVVEFLDNDIKILKNSDPFRVCTNFIIHNALPNLLGNCPRYDFAYNFLYSRNGIVSMNDGMEILNNVSQNHTMWSTVYNMKTGEIQVAPGRKFSSVYNFNLKMNE